MRPYSLGRWGFLRNPASVTCFPTTALWITVARCTLHAARCTLHAQDTELATSAILSILRLLIAVERKEKDAALAALLARAKREYWTDDESKGDADTYIKELVVRALCNSLYAFRPPTQPQHTSNAAALPTVAVLGFSTVRSRTVPLTVALRPPSLLMAQPRRSGSSVYSRMAADAHMVSAHAPVLLSASIAPDDMRRAT